MSYIRVTAFSRTLVISCDHIVKIFVSKLDEIIDTIRGYDGFLVDLTERRGRLVTTIHVVAHYAWGRAGFPRKNDTVRRWPGVSLDRHFGRATRRFVGSLRSRLANIGGSRQADSSRKEDKRAEQIRQTSG